MKINLKKAEARHKRMQARLEAKINVDPNGVNAISEFARQKQREWHWRINDTKYRIYLELKGNFFLTTTIIPRKYYYEYGITDEEIELMKSIPKLKKNPKLTWRNLLWVVGRKRREQRGLLKRGDKYYFVKSEFRMKYSKYLASESWKQKRLLVLQRDNFCCQDCGIDLQGKLAHVHHLTYDRIFNEELSDLQTLCPECHMKEHNLA
jgi:hypothetical protein